MEITKGMVFQLKNSSSQIEIIDLIYDVTHGCESVLYKDSFSNSLRTRTLNEFNMKISYEDFILIKK